MKNQEPHKSLTSQSWKTYLNDEYGFSLRYPADLQLVANPDAHHDYNYDPFFEPGEYDYDPTFTPVVELAQGPGRNETTDGIVAGIKISVSDAGATVSCRTTPGDETSNALDFQPGPTMAINGVNFTTFDAKLDVSKVGLNGATFGARYFRTVHGNRCYSIEVSDSGAGFASAPGVDKNAAAEDAARARLPFNAYDGFQELISVAQTFQFSSRSERH